MRPRHMTACASSRAVGAFKRRVEFWGVLVGEVFEEAEEARRR
jgi:hypothetical protein